MEKITKSVENHNTNTTTNVVRVQRKIVIGGVNDPMEHEADKMADKVMRMPDPEFIQRKCAHCEEDGKNKLQRKSLASFIQKKGAESGMTAGDHVSKQINATRGGGSALSHPTKRFMESRFGADFSDVKIHSNNQASEMAQSLNAQAFTIGKDIYFNKGQYNPSSEEGKRLMAHELVHTVQQNANKAPENIQREVSIVDKIKNILGFGPSEKELLEDISKNASKASDLLDKADRILKVADKLFKENDKIRQKLQQASDGLKKISDPVKKLKEVTQIAQKALTVLEFADAVEELGKIDISKNPDEAAKAFDKVFRSAGELYGLLPQSIQNLAPELKLLQYWGSFFENMTYGLHPSKRKGSSYKYMERCLISPGKVDDPECAKWE